MATTGSVFLKLTNASLVGSTVQAAGTVGAYDPTAARTIVAEGGGTRLDGPTAGDFSADALAKHGSSYTTLTGTTPVTLSLLDLTSNSTYSAGDTVFATATTLLVTAGVADITIAPGGSNPFSLGLAGTTPTLTVPAGKTVMLSFAAQTVDSTHKSILITPTAGGSVILCVAGA